MSKKISGAEYNLDKIFSSDFEYVMPSYQRPYAWTVDQALELFEDLFDFHKSSDQEEYFLGSIVLIKNESEPYSEVIDGQQRLTTLTILISALASIFEGKERDNLRPYIQEPGNQFTGLEPKPRLTLRDRDKSFFLKYVQELNFNDLLDLDEKNLDNEAQINIQKISRLYLYRISEQLGNDLHRTTKFITFLLKRCFLVVVSTPSQQSAFRVFSVMNSRGLELQTTDIIKADIIGKLSTEQEREEYSQRWEDMEVELGRSGFNDLFSYVRMIYAKEKAKRSLLDEFRTHVLKRVEEPKKLISQILEPFSDTLATVWNFNYEATKHAEEVNTYLRWLNRIDNSDWIPAAILFLSKNKNDPEYVVWFFRKLERLAAYMHICSLYVNGRIERYNEVIKDLEGIHNSKSPVQAVELTADEKERMRNDLRGNIYELTPRRRNYLILRLDAFVSDGAASYDPRILTIEHVLPQTVDPGSEWALVWPDEQSRKAWVHKLANLIPLNRRRNSQAQNYDFEKKKVAYFSGKKGVSSYALTTQVLKNSEWTAETLANRQEELLDVLEENWELAC